MRAASVGTAQRNRPALVQAPVGAPLTGCLLTPCGRRPPPLPTVSRIKCRSDLYEMDMILDVNVDVYPVDVSPALATAWPLGVQREAAGGCSKRLQADQLSRRRRALGVALLLPGSSLRAWDAKAALHCGLPGTAVTGIVGGREAPNSASTFRTTTRCGAHPGVGREPLPLPPPCLCRRWERSWWWCWPTHSTWMARRAPPPLTG